MEVRLSVATVKVLLILASMSFGYWWYLDRIHDIGSTLGAVVYFALWLLTLVAVLSVAFFCNAIPRVILAVILCGSALIVEAYREIMGEYFTFDAFVTIYSARAFVGEAVAEYYWHAAKPVLASVLLLAGILLPSRPPRRLNRSAQRACLFTPLALLLISTVIVYSRGGAGIKGLPGCIIVPPYAMVLAYEAAKYKFLEPVDHASVSIDLEPDTAVKDIVLLVDEAVRGDYLEGSYPDGTGYQLIRGGDAVHDFGYAPSATNCSNGSNLILRYGGTRDRYVQYINAMPAIWEYARKAGLKTVYIDGQREHGRLQNGMYQDELDLIDTFVQFDNTSVVDRDIAIANKLVELTRNNQAEFIYVNKVGAHFPVHDKYPDDYMIFKPVLSRGRFLDLTDQNINDYYSDDTDDWEWYINAYKNTLLWNVGRFFDIVFENSQLENTVIFYTSDHGQNFHEDGSPGHGTHCLNRPSPDEGLVPQILITRNTRWGDTAGIWADRNFNSTSHFNLFPTILEVMGYSVPEVRKVYGPTLFEPTNDPMTFLSKFNRFSRTPTWTRIRPQSQLRTSRPPAEREG